MYSVLPQKYNYRKSISVSACINLLIFFILMQTHGKILANFSQKHTNKHTISARKYKIIHQISEKSSSSDDSAVNQAEEVQKDEIKKVVEMPDVQAPKPLPKPVTKEQPKKPTPKSETTQEKSSVMRENISKQITQEKTTMETSEQGEDTEPASDASYFGLNNEAPTYPIMSFQLGESGEVTIEYIISKEGDVIFAQILTSSGFQRLDRVALIEFKRWKFTPAKNIMGQPVDSKKKVITFAFDIKTQGIIAK